MTDRTGMDTAMAAGFDFVAMARALLREPDLLTRIRADASTRSPVHPLQPVHANDLLRHPVPAGHLTRGRSLAHHPVGRDGPSRPRHRRPSSWPYAVRDWRAAANSSSMDAARLRQACK